VLVCLGAIAVYGGRFGFAHYLGIELVSAQQLIHQAYTHTYPAFLLLYVMLIVMACTSQHLYRTSREIRALERASRLLKPSDLPRTFWFFSPSFRPTEISRMVVVSAGAGKHWYLGGLALRKRLYVLRRARRGERSITCPDHRSGENRADTGSLAGEQL